MDALASKWLGLLAVFALVLLNGFFVAAEFALVSVRKSRIEQLANEGNRAARSVQRAMVHLDTYIAATQLGITMASLALGVIGEPALAGLLEPLFDQFLPAKGARITAHGVSVTIAFAIATALHIVIGELAPKSVALQRPDTTALWVTAPLDIFLRVFKPFILLLNSTGNLVVRLLGLKAVTEHGSVHSVEELQILVHSTREAGLLEAQQEKMVTGIFGFEETPIRKAMTPRLDIHAIPLDTVLGEAVRLHLASKHSRMPVFERDLDNIVGVVHLMDLLEAEQLGGKTLSEVMRRPYIVPDTRKAGDLLASLQREKLQMAIVQDEYGTVVGLVTMVDLLEEIVGDIHDEHEPADIPDVISAVEGTTLVSGKMDLIEFCERMGMPVPEEEIDTVGGLVFALLGHQPQGRETVEYEGFVFQVEETDGHRILVVRVTRAAATSVPAPRTTGGSSGSDIVGLLFLLGASYVPCGVSTAWTGI